MIAPETFKCNRGCADCCKDLIVKLYKKDIKEIKRAGYEEEFFSDFDTHIKSPILRFINHRCVFLGNKKGKYYCRIYEFRPKVCRFYPFINSSEVESCKPELLKNKYEK